MPPREFERVEACVDAILERIGNEIVVGTPLGVGKANHILNELVERAVDNPEINLKIWTALTLTKPGWNSDLERRLVEPLSERVFGNYPNLTYADRLKNETLPDNVEIHEFYFPPGEYLDVGRAQQNYHSVNYTHVLREIWDAGVNVILQLVGVGDLDGERHYNLSSNTDLSADLVDMLRQRRESGGEDAMIVGQVNRNLPFMYGDGPVHEDKFDAVLDAEKYEFPLYGPPNLPVETEEHLIGLRVSSLIKDGGTLQIGIGSLGDAIAWSTNLRHQNNEAYRELVDSFGVHSDCPELVDEYGGLAPFDEGLYGGTEMFVEAFLQLFESGVVSREVYNDIPIQRLINEGRIDERVTTETLDALVDEGAISETLDADDVTYLKKWGIFRDDVQFAEDELSAGGVSIEPDLSDAAAREKIAEHALGDELEGGHLLHAGFFLGPTSFYETLREMDDELRRKMGMMSVQFTNQLYRHEELNRLQRLDARFVNTAMMATVSGGIVADGLDDNRVVSGVGGQFNFVNMAHELEGGRSIIMVRATRASHGEVESNIEWNYGHITIPRHLRDIVVTEYGVADLRGKTDGEVIAEMINVADSRFQDELVEKAKGVGKLPEDYEVPERYRNNYPENLEKTAEKFRDRGLLPRFPYGTDLTREEIALTRSLRLLKENFEGPGLPTIDDIDSLPKTVFIPDEAEPYLERMNLADPSSPKEEALRRAVVFALAEADYI